MFSEVEDESEAGRDKGAASAAEKQMYDCVICNQATPSTDDRPLGLVALLQPTSGQYSLGGSIVYHPSGGEWSGSNYLTV